MFPLTLASVVRQTSAGFRNAARIVPSCQVSSVKVPLEKWLVLREQSLSVHKNEVSFPSSSRVFRCLCVNFNVKSVADAGPFLRTFALDA